MTRSMPWHTEAAKPMQSAGRARSYAKKPDSFADVACTPEDTEEEVDDSQGHEQDLSSGRCGTRTHDLSRVKTAPLTGRCWESVPVAPPLPTTDTVALKRILKDLASDKAGSCRQQPRPPALVKEHSRILGVPEHPPTYAVRGERILAASDEWLCAKGT